MTLNIAEHLEIGFNSKEKESLQEAYKILSAIGFMLSDNENIISSQTAYKTTNTEIENARKIIYNILNSTDWKAIKNV